MFHSSSHPLRKSQVVVQFAASPRLGPAQVWILRNLVLGENGSFLTTTGSVTEKSSAAGAASSAVVVPSLSLRQHRHVGRQRPVEQLGHVLDLLYGGRLEAEGGERNPARQQRVEDEPDPILAVGEHLEMELFGACTQRFY